MMELRLWPYHGNIEAFGGKPAALRSTELPLIVLFPTFLGMRFGVVDEKSSQRGIVTAHSHSL
jgi:hypothetical protein